MDHTNRSNNDIDIDSYIKAIRKSRGSLIKRVHTSLKKDLKTWGWNLSTLVLVVSVVFSVALPFLQEALNHVTYNISNGEEGVLLETNDYMAKKLIYDGKEGVYNFNQDYTPRNPGSDLGAGGSLIRAKLYENPQKGIQITDPINNVDFTLKPLFWVGDGKQQQNRIVYPAPGGGHLVYTAGAVGIKEDITIPKYVEDTATYTYELELGDQFEARVEAEGSVGIYGSSLPITGNVSTGSDADAALLAKARKAAKKDKLLFTLPAPTIKESNNHVSNAKAHFEIKDNKLSIHAQHLKQATYPISIDPTITATAGSTGNGLFSFDANIETNVYIHPSNNYFSRSPLTGGNLLSWSTSSSGLTGNLNAPHYLGGAIVYGGTLYVIGGASGTGTSTLTGSNYIEQAKINSNGSLNTVNAGINTFSSGNATGLPAGGIARFQLLTYNGYLYIVGGITGFTSTAAGGTVSSSVYYTRITSESYGAYNNGSQLKDWSTTTGSLTTGVYSYGGTVYNGTMYIAGGLNSAGTAQTAVQYTNLQPSGNISGFSAARALPAGRFGLDMQSYNGHLYIIGGNTGTLASASLTASTLYASIATDGSIIDAAWKTSTNLVSSNGASTQAIENFGVPFTMIYNGYLYASGGCTSVASGTCASGNVASYSQLAQLNADGSLGTFFPNDFQNGGNATMQKTGTPTVGYNGFMYSLGGCSAPNTGSVSCTTTVSTTSWVQVNTVVGDISNNRNPGDLPFGTMGAGTVVLNGFLYVIGGCLTVSCSGTRVTSYDTYWAQIAADGTLGSWTGTNTTDATHYQMALHRDGANGSGGGDTGNSNCSSNTFVQGADNCGLASMAVAVYNGYIYTFGGADGANVNHTVYYTKPNASTGALTGNPAWTTSANQISNTDIAEAGAFARNGALYVIGGCTGGGAGIGCTGYRSVVVKSTIGANGAPGTFSTTNQLQLPANGRAAFGLALSGDYIYLAGGIDNANNQLSTIVRAKLDSSGNIVTVGTGWVATQAVMPTVGGVLKARRRTGCAVINGYIYVIGGHNAADTTGGANGTTYGDILIGQIDMSTGGSGDIAGTFNATSGKYELTQTSTGAVTPRWDLSIATGAGFIFATGGCTTGYPPGNCTVLGTTDEAFVVYNANSLGVNSWNNPTNHYSAGGSNTNLASRLGAGTAVYNGYLYVAGGCSAFAMNPLNCSVTQNDTAYAAINADGTLGTWASGGTFTTATGFGQLVALNGYLYYMGGQTSTDATSVSNMYYSQINSSTGAPGTWTATTKALGDTGSGGNARTMFGAVAYANRIFIAGGCSGNPCTNQTTVYVSQALTSGGDITSNWTSTGAFTTARRELSLASAGAYLYVIGGFDGSSTYYSDVQVATPNTSTGAISSWSRVEDIPYAEGGLSAMGANGYIFVFGGRNGNVSSSCSSAVYSAAVNGNGTLGRWQQAPNSLGTARFGMGIGFYNGYFFLNGGDDCTNVSSGATTIQQSGQLSEAMRATYTRYVDFGTDATFRQLYILGTNAQISSTDIDLWKIIVKTSTSYNNSWGQKYTTSLNGLGTGPNYGSPITFQALDGSGNNTGAAQYWDITFDIDQAQSFNFPDTSQPQITKYDFYFSPGPGKRMRDGKTFINEQQSNLDAHP